MGTKICWGGKQQTAQSLSQTFPVAFKSVPYIVISLYDADGGSWYCPVKTAHSVSAFTTSITQYSFKPYIYYIAIGR